MHSQQHGSENQLKQVFTMRRGVVLLAVVMLAALAYLVFAPMGLLWLYRTGGWDSWATVLNGQVTEEGAVAFPVHIKWDFVCLTVIPKPSAAPPPTDEVVIRVVGDSGQYITVSCGRWNKERNGTDENTLVWEHTTGGSVRVYEGSLTELNQHWCPIQAARGDGGNRIDFQLIVEGKHGRYENDAIPFTLQAQWSSVGF